jgi:hypothetical protein
VTQKFIFWAQALDNVSPDSFLVYGDEVSPDETLRRQEAVSAVSNVIKIGTQLFSVRGVQLTADANHFVAETPSAQRDRVGRTAPIVCYGDYDATFGEGLPASVADALNAFANRIGRNIEPEHLGLVRDSFLVLKKNSSMRRLLRNVAFGTAVLALVALAYWLASRSS